MPQLRVEPRLLCLLSPLSQTPLSRSDDCLTGGGRGRNNTRLANRVALFLD